MIVVQRQCLVNVTHKGDVEYTCSYDSLILNERDCVTHDHPGLSFNWEFQIADMGQVSMAKIVQF